MSGHDHNDLDVEPIPGLPSEPPAGEDILWQGRPSWRRLAVDGFKVPWLAGYFAFFAALRGLNFGLEAKSAAVGVSEALLVAPLGALGVALVVLLAWAHARATIYTITSKRVVMRFGIALPMTFNLPFRQLQSAGVRVGKLGHGDIALSLAEGNTIAWPVLWPHARPWQFKKASPMLRAIGDVATVANVLATAQRGWGLSRRAAPAVSSQVIVAPPRLAVAS